MRVSVNGHYYRLRWVDHNRGFAYKLGEIDCTSKKNKEIRLARGQSPVDLADTIIHECMHAGDAFDVIAEEYIAGTATSAARILEKVGLLRSAEEINEAIDGE